MVFLAVKNLFYNKIRLAVTLVGIIFSVVLSAVQLGLFVGFQHATSDVINRSNADIWITSQNLSNIEEGIPFSEQKFYRILAIEEVESAAKQIIQFSPWKKDSGATVLTLLVGFNTDKSLGTPWNLTAGKVEDLNLPDSVIVDELYKLKLGITSLKQTVEIRGHKAKVVGFTKGIRTFTSTPTVFTSFKNAQNYSGLRQDQTLYILIKAKNNADLQTLKTKIQKTIEDVDVYTREELTIKQQNHWLLESGAGITVLIAAVLGLLVGVVIVAQTIYAATIDHIREYGTLKAIGATNFYLYRIIIGQALTCGLIGYSIGIAIALLISYISLQSTTAVILPIWLLISLFILTMMMCIIASVISINKVTRIDPAEVFRE